MTRRRGLPAKPEAASRESHFKPAVASAFRRKAPSGHEGFRLETEVGGPAEAGPRVTRADLVVIGVEGYREDGSQVFDRVRDIEAVIAARPVDVRSPIPVVAGVEVPGHSRPDLGRLKILGNRP